MKIVDIKIEKEIEKEVPGGFILSCRCKLENGEEIAGAHPWRNPHGLWASDSDARDPAEIAATLRSFAKAIEDATRGGAAA